MGGPEAARRGCRHRGAETWSPQRPAVFQSLWIWNLCGPEPMFQTLA
jgi:hypothetical protein